MALWDGVTYGGWVPRKPPTVYQITGVPRSLTEDVHHREVRYLISMGIRTACLILAVVSPWVPLRVLFLIGALVLPYIAVVAANAGRETSEAPIVLDPYLDRPQLEAPPEHPGAERRSA